MFEKLESIVCWKYYELAIHGPQKLTILTMGFKYWHTHTVPVSVIVRVIMTFVLQPPQVTFIVFLHPLVEFLPPSLNLQQNIQEGMSAFLLHNLRNNKHLGTWRSCFKEEYKYFTCPGLVDQWHKLYM